MAQVKTFTNEDLRALIEMRAVDCITAAFIDNVTGGFCAGWLREVAEEVRPEIFHHPAGLNARAAFKWYEARGMHIQRKRGSVPGDFLFKVGPNHGKHGHCGIRVQGNRVAENSSVHGIGQEDARGFRDLKSFGSSYEIIRPKLIGAR